MSKTGRDADSEIDLVLSVICIIAKRDQNLSCGAIAELCGCSRHYIRKVEQRALTKLRNNNGTRLKELRDFYYDN